MSRSLRTARQRRTFLKQSGKSPRQLQIERNLLVNKFADKMRSNPTKAEQELFGILSEVLPRYKVRFFFQHVIAGKIVDFYLPDQRIIIEVDGGYHYAPGQQKKDREREGKIRTKGRKVIRFDNEEVLSTPIEVIAKILKKCGRSYEVRLGEM